VDSRAEELTRYVARGTELVERILERSTLEVGDLRSHLRALSPQRTLDRGYAIAQGTDGHVLRAAPDAPAGTPFTLTLAAGRIAAHSDGQTDEAIADRR
jgi:exodeoxyribonuclease VII large subunit